MDRQEAINALLPELNDIGEALAAAYKILNVGEQLSWIELKMQTIRSRSEAVSKRLGWEDAQHD